jgi:hypothetical protein
MGDTPGPAAWAAKHEQELLDAMASLALRLLDEMILEPEPETVVAAPLDPIVVMVVQASMHPRPTTVVGVIDAKLQRATVQRTTPLLEMETGAKRCQRCDRFGCGHRYVSDAAHVPFDSMSVRCG